MSPLFSIVVPVYNVDKYLAECVDSLLAQDTSEPYEILLIDDGSTDRSGAICDEYAAAHEQVRVFHKPNGGVSSARNLGIEQANGIYLLFADPDDLWQPCLLSTLLPCLISKPDMAVYGAEIFDMTGVIGEILPAVLPQGESGEIYLNALFQKEQLPSVTVWSYAYKREFLCKHNLCFSTALTVAEDFDFNFSCLTLAQAVHGTDAKLYRYRLRAGSLSQQSSPCKFLQKAYVDVKCFRRYPVAALANFFCYQAFKLSRCGTQEELSELLSLYADNIDILDAVTGFRQKFARFLFRQFWFYHGSAIIMTMIDMRHSLSKTPTEMAYS